MRPQIGAYARISLDAEGRALGVARQQADIAKLADLKGWDIADSYVDNNLSAYKHEVVRPQFERLLTDLENGRINGIVAYDLDRITRQPAVFERIVRIYEQRRGLFFATVQGSIDLSTSDGLFMARTLINVANKSSADTSRRIKRKNIERAEAGLPHGSRRPYGYQEDQLTLHPEEAPILREMGMRFLGGESYRGIAEWLEAAGHKTTMGRQWYPITVRNTLRRPRYGGLRMHDGVEYQGVWEPVFTRDEWDAIQFLIKHRREAAGSLPAATKYLLTGIAVCGACGGFLNGETKRDAPHKPLRRTYQCKHCHGVTRNADALDHFIRELVCYRLDSPEAHALFEPDGDYAVSMRNLVGERDVLMVRRNAALEDYADGTLSKADLSVVQNRIDTKLEEIERQITDARRSHMNINVSAGDSVRDAWMTRTIGWKRTLVTMLISKVEVQVGKTKPYYMADGKRMRFDPSLINVTWEI